MRACAAALLLVAVLAGGCWDRREIEEQTLVLASGIDACDGVPASDCLTITRQIAIPGRIPLGQATSVAPARTMMVLSSSGRDAMESAATAQSELHRKISFGHLRILVFGEELARHGLEYYVDYLRRLPDIRRLMWVAVSEGPAVDVMRARPRLERVPALYLNDMMEDAARTGRIPKIFLGEFLGRLSSEGEEAVVPLMKVAGPDQPALAGLAVFRGPHMVGRLSPDESVTFMEIIGLRQGAELLAVNMPDGGTADLRVSERGSHFRFRWVNGKLQATVRIRLESELLQVSPGTRSNDPRVITRIEELAAAEVTRRAEALVRRLQQDLQADILGVGERVRAQMPGVWSGIKEWPVAFREAQFRFDVRVYIRRTLMAAY